MKNNYQITLPKGKKVPILVSVPHGGTAFPLELEAHYKKDLAANPDDTDFFVQDLYDFAPDMGITMIQAKYSRWVIDLNRSPRHKPLYGDGRIITKLTPTTNFLGASIYESPDFEPPPQEIDRRIQSYFRPYYAAITKILKAYLEEFGMAILWDAHSIRRSVPTIQDAPFPDFVLGTNDGNSASAALIESARKNLSAGSYDLSYNTPFKGGNITRHFGKPAKNIHALQLEMCKDLYMDDAELVYDPARAEEVRAVLKETLSAIHK